DLRNGSSTTWEMLSPPLRQAHTIIYDSKRDRMVMFGGTDGTPRNDTWALSLKGNLGWELLQTVGEVPPRLMHHSTIYDPVRDRMIVLAGLGNADSSVWALSFGDGNRWTQLEQTGDRPGVSNSGQAIYDSRGDRLIFLSGLVS